MRRLAVALILALVASATPDGQTTAVLRISITLRDAAQAVTPVPRHALLISDNPATSAPRRVITSAAGTVDVTLTPGLYTIESDQPVVFFGQAFQWTQMVDMVAARESTLALTADNAESVPMSAVETPSGGSEPPPNDSGAAEAGVSRGKRAVVTLWSPTRRATGVLVDARGLFATTAGALALPRAAAGTGTPPAPMVEVQVSATLKVAGRVISSDVARDAALVWIDPTVIGSMDPVPLSCPPPPSLALDEHQELAALAAGPGGVGDVALGEVTGLRPRAADTDLRLPFGGAGGPAFDAAGHVVGLTAPHDDLGAGDESDVELIRLSQLCDALQAARERLAGATPPPPTPLPIEPTRPFPVEPTSLPATPGAVADPAHVSSDQFDLVLLTPIDLHRARQRADWSGGPRARSAEVEARIGGLTDFGPWSPYFADAPAVVVVRVTPRLVEGFWKRLAREAARTQGAALPAFKDFTANFVRMRARCGTREIVPLHPFVIEHRMANEVVREGLYVFHPDAFDHGCDALTLAIDTERPGSAPHTVTLPAATIAAIREAFAAYRAARL